MKTHRALDCSQRFRLPCLVTLLVAVHLFLTSCIAGTAGAPLVSYAGPVPDGALARLGKGRIDALALSPDGRTLTVGTDVGLALYDAQTMDQQWSQASTLPIRAVAYAPDGRLLAAGAADGQVSIVATATGQVLDALKAPAAVSSLAWGPASASVVGQPGALLAAGFANGDAVVTRIDDAGDGPRLSPAGQLPRHPAGVSELAFSPDGALLATGDISGGVHLWAVPNLERIGGLQGHPSFHRVQALTWLPNSQELVSADAKGRVLAWRVDRSEPEQELAHEGSAVLAVQADPSGVALSAAKEDGSVTTWSTEDSPVHQELESRVAATTAAAWSADRRIVAMATADGGLTTWQVDGDTSDAELLASLQGHAGRYAPANAVVWSPDGSRLATGLGTSVALWRNFDGQPERVLTGHTQPVTALAWSPNGSEVASGGRDREIRLWDARNGRLIRELTGHADYVADLAWSPDGRQLASAGALDHTARIWDARDGREVRTIAVEGEDFWSVAWSPDGTTLAAGTTSGDILLWDLAGEAMDGPSMRLRGHLAWVADLAWSPDGRRLASASADGEALLWDMEAQTRVPVAAHNSVVRGLAFSPDGRQLATAAKDGLVMIWDVAPEPTLRVVRTLAGHTSGVNSVAWSADGRRLASGSDDGSVLIWEVEPLAMGSQRLPAASDRQG